MESKVIVIHHGSHSLKIGLASDSVPKTIPNFIARKRKDLTKPPPTTTTTATTTPSSTNTSTTPIELDNNNNNNKKDDSENLNKENENENENIMKLDNEKTETTEPSSSSSSSSMDIDSNKSTTPANTTIPTTTTTTPITQTTTTTTSSTKIHVPRKLLEEVEISVKETTKLLPPVDYIKVRQKPILYNENNSTTSEVVKKKKKKTTTPTTTTTTTTTTTATTNIYTPPILNYNEIDYCIGEDAITVGRDKSKWITYQPITMSTFNSGIYNSVQSMYDDITQMWKYAIQRYLNIPSSDLSSYGCVYIVTDNIDKKSLKQITTLILKELQFTSVLFFQESICSTFGVSMSSQSCVVDIGHQKISIACVDEGYLLPNTRITLGYGGEQLTKLLEYLLTGMDRSDTDTRLTISKQIHKYYFPFKSSPNEFIDFSPFYLNVFDLIKIENLDFNYNDFQKQRVSAFKVKDIKKEKILNTYHFNADEVYQVVGMSLFHPNVLTQFGGSSVNYIINSKPLLICSGNGNVGNGASNSNVITVEDQKHYYNYYISSYDYDDAFDNHIYTTAIGINNKADTTNSSTNTTTTSSSSSSSSSPTKKVKVNKNSINEEYIDISLDLAINKSVSLLERSDINKKKYLSNILLVGGGALIPGIQDVLKVRVYKQLEQQYQQQQLLLQQQLQQQQQQQQQLLQQQQQQQNLNSSTNSTPTILATPIIQPLENYIGFAGSASIRTDVDARHASWRGGAILGCLESSKEIWITRNEWQDGKNSSALNKLPF